MSEEDDDAVPGIRNQHGVGRPAHKPSETTKTMVTSAIGMGLDQTSIGALLDITPKTLRKFYRHELDTGAAKANFSVAKSLYGRASGGKDTIASIFWLKARAGWQDTTKTVHEGLPEQITVSFALEPPKVEHQVIDVTPEKQIENAD
tara:strand:+ start:219 stop:659 length:441 start_codon:yes stop_codon:yes gene_type:complete